MKDLICKFTIKERSMHFKQGKTYRAVPIGASWEIADRKGNIHTFTDYNYLFYDAPEKKEVVYITLEEKVPKTTAYGFTGPKNVKVRQG